MKRFSKSTLGVTLLEIMLVLAIAAMIIVMSIRYYQSATSSQQANTILQQVQAIAAAADGLGQATGSYSQVTLAKLTQLMPTGGMTAPWGGAITLSSAAAGSYTISIDRVPVAVCPLLNARLAAFKNISGVTACGGSAPQAVSYTYSMNP